MKIKIFFLFLISMLLLMVLPTIVLGHEDVDEYLADNHITYQLFKDGTAKIISIKNDLVNEMIIIDNTITYEKEDYQITTIGKNAFNEMTEEHDLHIYCKSSPVLEEGISFENISVIYVPIGAEGYTEENGWEEEKVKNYKITQQPQDIIVTAGNIGDTDVVEVAATIPVLTFGTSIQYSWYYCDEDGNIIEKADLESVEGKAEYKIPADLSYDNENKQAKDYYLVCVVGEGSQGAILEKSRVVKITVNPGTYKISFSAGGMAEWTIEAEGDFIEVAVNSERKIESSHIPSSDDLKPYGKGFTFIGWSLDEKNKVDLATMTFEKNTVLFPIWQYTVKFDACGGSFSNGNSALEFTTTHLDFEIYESIEEMSNPIRDGYEFLGFFDAETGGTSLEYYLAEDGIFEETTFYAQWKKYNDYDIKEGNHQTWNGKGDLNFVVDADEAKWTNMLFGLKNADNVGPLNENVDFTIGSNGVITLKESFLKSLAEGEYQLISVYNDGEAIIYFTVKYMEEADETIEEENKITGEQVTNSTNESSNPQTGDNILVFVGLFVIAIIGIYTTTKLRKNK